jgi:hypothetical protein
LFDLPKAWEVGAEMLGRRFEPSVRSRTLRFYAGQPDFADASHFTLKYKMNCETWTLDGWVQDDHMKAVLLEVRDGPAARK